MGQITAHQRYHWSITTKGVEHSEVDIQLGNEVNILEEASDPLNTRLAFSKAKLEDFKSKFLS